MDELFTVQGFKIDDLCHSGVKGQKWGLRRWQNPDGSLTPAGREHYGIKGIRAAGKQLATKVSAIGASANKKVKDISTKATEKGKAIIKTLTTTEIGGKGKVKAKAKAKPAKPKTKTETKKTATKDTKGKAKTEAKDKKSEKKPEKPPTKTEQLTTAVSGLTTEMKKAHRRAVMSRVAKTAMTGVGVVSGLALIGKMRELAMDTTAVGEALKAKGHTVLGKLLIGMDPNSPQTAVDKTLDAAAEQLGLGSDNLFVGLAKRVLKANGITDEATANKAIGAALKSAGVDPNLLKAGADFTSGHQDMTPEQFGAGVGSFVKNALSGASGVASGLSKVDPSTLPTGSELAAYTASGAEVAGNVAGVTLSTVSDIVEAADEIYQSFV